MTGETKPCAVITGIGVVAPTGHGVDEYWRATLAGRSGLGELDRFTPNPYPVRVAGQLRDFVAGEHVPSRLVPQTDLWTQQGLAQARLALQDAKLEPDPAAEYRLAVVTAGSAGGVEFGQREIEKLWYKGPGFVGAYQSIAWFYAATTGQLSIRHKMRGQCDALVTEGAGGLDALGGAARLVSDGAVVLSGGSDSALSPYALVCQMSGGRLSTGCDPRTAYLPFDADAAGHVPGEGGAMFVVEDLAEALIRGAPYCYGTIAGYAATFDPPPGSGRSPTLARAIRQALVRAGVAPGDVDVVFADAAGIADLDRQEADALGEVFGPGGVPVTAPKTAIGRLHSGGGAVDVAAALMSIKDGVIPPTVNVRRPRPEYRLDLVLHRPRHAPVRTAMVVSRGYGGFNSALVLRAVVPI